MIHLLLIVASSQKVGINHMVAPLIAAIRLGTLSGMIVPVNKRLIWVGDFIDSITTLKELSSYMLGANNM